MSRLRNEFTDRFRVRSILSHQLRLGSLHIPVDTKFHIDIMRLNSCPVFDGLADESVLLIKIEARAC